MQKFSNQLKLSALKRVNFSQHNELKFGFLLKEMLIFNV